MSMKAIITILILALVGWGIWQLVDGPDEIDVEANGPAGEVQGAQNQNDEIDLGDFQDKG